MKKYIAIFAGLVLGLSLGLTQAQITGGGVQSNCVRWDPVTNECLQRSTTVNVNTGTAPTYPAGQYPAGQYPQQPVYQPGQPGYPQPVTPSYQTGPSTRRIGSNAIDFSFFGGLVQGTGSIVRMLPAVLLGIAVVFFFFYLIKFLIATRDDATAKQKSLKGLMYSLIAIFIMVTLWGIIAFFGDTLGLNTNVKVFAPEVPQVPLR